DHRDEDRQRRLGEPPLHREQEREEAAEEIAGGEEARQQDDAPPAFLAKLVPPSPPRSLVTPDHEAAPRTVTPPVTRSPAWTCTSSGDRKVATRTDGPTNGSSSSSTDITWPSAGDSTAPGMAGVSRSGSRKKPREASDAATKGTARARRPVSASPAAIAAGIAMKGQPSRATGSFDIIPFAAARSTPSSSADACRPPRSDARRHAAASQESRRGWPGFPAPTRARTGRTGSRRESSSSRPWSRR